MVLEPIAASNPSGVTAPPPKSTQIENSSREVKSVDSFWPISSSHHGSGSNPSRLYATLYYANITADEASLEGRSRSYIDIVNDGRLDGDTSFTWIFNITPAILQEAVILEYFGNGMGPGVQFLQVNESLKVKIFDDLGNFVDEAIEDAVLSIGSWNFVGFNYIPERGDVSIIKDTIATTHHITDSNPEANALGNVRIGASTEGSLPFEGSVNCIQFYELALVDKALLKPITFCDPNLWSPDVLVSDYWSRPIKEECITYKKTENNHAFDSSSVVILTASGTSLVQCVVHCLREQNCAAFTLDVAGTCTLAANGGPVGAISGGFSGTGQPGTLVNGVFGIWGSTGDPGWTILLKGVSGVPGDLYSLWAGPKTLNTNQPKAWDFTNHFKGHYKPEASNHWNRCSFDKVKLSIYKAGKEKANIVFNARGATKMNWMDPSRIISSTFSDIKNAPHDVFGIRGDTNRGREFYASSASGIGCDQTGWIMVSTKNNCFYEGLSQKPAFLYSTTGIRTRWGSAGLPGEGDVMVISGHGGHCMANNTNSQSLKCLYKGKSYSTGDNWQDGCDYNCTCVDEQTNFYQCNELCPHINVPPHCHLVKKPGSCCSVAKCDQSHDGCFYKNHFYTQGQIWEDGCDYRCRCEDAQRGFYQCKTKCLQWQLPSQCHLASPPAGKCCPVPTCPPGYIINYPPGYKQE
ncbi:uncharacterized protein LOC121389360 [Gigantopelta aegis]|uniref:uncharacterized protein LOC121389360 n=1 Tax=Gigantopelta aegis TaxID=1735272 RepID=UPI001B88BC9A|nr:uncharacterized protein LOC121389360 [Gigantopelta aegis]